MSKSITATIRAANASAQAEETKETASAAPASIRIDTDIPMPEGRQTGGKYPWADLKIGQSFFVPGGKLTTWATSCNKAGKTHAGKSYICRAWTEKGDVGSIEGVRVWRKA